MPGTTLCARHAPCNDLARALLGIYAMPRCPLLPLLMAARLWHTHGCAMRCCHATIGSAGVWMPRECRYAFDMHEPAKGLRAGYRQSSHDMMRRESHALAARHRRLLRCLFLLLLLFRRARLSSPCLAPVNFHVLASTERFRRYLCAAGIEGKRRC